MLPIVVPDRFRIAAHRGASAYAPENTLAAFGLAHRMGAREVELDTRLSSDGEVVICHDSTLERYGHGPRAVEEMTSEELFSLDMGSWFSPFFFAGEKMPTLRALLDLYGDALTYHIELKGEGKDLPRAVALIIADHGIRDGCFVISFSYDALARAKETDPALRLGWLVERISDDTLAGAAALGLSQLCIRADSDTREAVTRARDVNAEVQAWRLLGTPAKVRELMVRVVESGCDGMTIDWPDWVVHEKDAKRA